MLADTVASRRRIIEARIVGELQRYFGQYREGMPMQVLSAKYARALSELGGFPEVMLALEQSGSITIDVALNGRRTVRPAVNKIDGVSPGASYWF